MDPGPLASDFRVVVGQLIRRMRADRAFPLAPAAVLARLDRGGAQRVSALAGLESVRPQSMAQTVKDMEAEGLVSRSPDPDDGRRAIVELTKDGLETLQAVRRRREDWLARAIAALGPGEREQLQEALPLLRQIAESRA